MNILRGRAQPKKSESFNQVFSQSLTENFLFFLIDILQLFSLLDVFTAHNVKYKRLRYSQSGSQSLIVNHFLKGFTCLLFVD